MELLSFMITTLLSTVMITLSIMTTPCLSHQTQLLLSSHQQVDDDHKDELSLTKVVLPRKLRPMNEDHSMVKSASYTSTTTDFKPVAAEEFNKHKKASPTGGNKLHNHGIMDGRKGTRQNWVESNAWQFFTMDYAHVRRRRPIHNKSVPRGP